MGWLSIQEFAQLKGISIQAVYKQVKDGRISSKKMDGDKLFVQHDFKDFDENIKAGEITHLIESGTSKELHNVKSFITDLLNQLKNHNDSELKKLVDALSSGAVQKVEESKNNEIRILNEKNEVIIKMKDDEIKRLKERGLFKRLFGG